MQGLIESDLAAVAELSPAALLVVDRATRVLHANPASRRLLARHAMVAVRDGVLVARRKSEDRALREALAGLTAAQPAVVFCFRNRQSLPVVVIDLHLLPSQAIALRITDLAIRPAPSAARMRSIFGLTAAEARVASALLSGMRIQDVAREWDVAPETVRSQVKRIRSKTGAHSQNELLGLLAAAGASLAETDLREVSGAAARR